MDIVDGAWKYWVSPNQQETYNEGRAEQGTGELVSLCRSDIVVHALVMNVVDVDPLFVLH